MIQRFCKLPESQSFFLFGPRGSGKSTLLQKHFEGLIKAEKVLWINLLDQAMDLRLSHNPDMLLTIWKKEKPKWVVIDEVQKIPRLLDVVHLGIEEHKIKFALTSSSARKLKRGGANLLAGRAVERRLLPFSALELGSTFNLNRGLESGLLPKIWSEDLRKADATDFLFSYVNTYLKEEIAAEQLVRNLEPFRRFLISAAQSNGKIINHAAIERDSGVAAKQSERHFEILEDTLLGRFLPPFELSIRKRQTKKSKFYFNDTGIVRALKNLAELDLESGTYEYGDLFETFIMNEFFKISSALSKKWEFSYFQTQNNNEIDLIIEKPAGKKILVEIKSFQRVHKEKISSYIGYKNDISHEVAYLLSNDKTEVEIEGVRCLHWMNGLKEIFDL